MAELKLLNMGKDKQERIKGLIEAIREETENIPDYQRMEIWNHIHNGYCIDCATRTGGRPCYCNQDD